MEWSNDKVTSLIDFYHDRPVLWNCKLKEYKDRNKRHAAFVEIAANFGVAKEEVERKLKNLICHFLREVKKERDSVKSGTESDEVYKSKWFAYRNMAFLKDRNQLRGMSDTQEVASQLDNENESNEGIGNDADKAEDSSCDARPVFPYIVIKEELFPPLATDDGCHYETPSKKIKKESEVDPLKEKMDVSKRPTSQQTSLKNLQRKDDCDLYGELIARKLKKMDERSRDIAMNRIDNLLFEMKINSYQRQ